MGNSGKAEASIQGTLLMMDDETPHVSVHVQALCDGEVVANALSDKQGRYRFDNLEQGEYQVRCYTLNGFVYYDDILKVEAGKTLAGIDFRFAPFKKGTWRNYTQFDGLGHNRIRAIYRTPDGLLWFGTIGGGLSCYDGRKFVNLRMEDGLVANEVWAIHQDPDGIMWLGTRGGVSCYDGEKFVNFTVKDGLGGIDVGAIHRDPDGVMWFATSGGLSRYDGEKFISFTTKDGLANDLVFAIGQDLDGVMWLGTAGGVSRYDGKKFVNFTTENGLAGNYVFSVHRDPVGVMWFGMFRGGGGVSRYDGKRFVNLTTKDGLAHNSISYIHCDPDGVAWFATSRYDGEGFINFTIEDGLAHNAVWGVYSHPDSAMWFGTDDGLSCYDEKCLANFTTRDGLVDNSVNAVYSCRDGAIWIGTAGGVSRYDGRDFVSYTSKDGLAGNNVNVIYCDPDGGLWFGTEGGVSYWDGKVTGDSPHFINYTEEDGLASNSIRDIHSDPDGLMWFGTGNGVSRYDDRGMGDCPHFVSFTTRDGLADNSVRTIQNDPDGILWFGMWNEGGICLYDGKSFTNYAKEHGLSNSWVNDICRTGNGTIWVGSSTGACYYDGEGEINFIIEDKLAYSWINTIYEDRDGTLWFGTRYEGVFCYNGRDWTSLDVRDGIGSNDVRSISQDSDGVMWFGTSEGVTRYIPGSTKPIMRILSVTTDKTYRDLSAVPAFAPGTRVTIEYDSIDFRTVPEKRQFRLRIREIDIDWRKATKETAFDWIAEEPGIYTFEVQAIDRDLNYSEPASVRLEVIPDPRNHQIAQLKGELAERERAELERVHQELEDARRIQLSLLPEKPPKILGFQMAGISKPAREVSGDFYSYLPLGVNTGIVLADVTGKSVKAAMVAAMTNGMLYSEIKGREELWNSSSKILKELNASLQSHLIRGMNTAMSLTIIGPDKKIIFSNAGMPYPVVKRGDKAWELEVTGFPLGIVGIAEYEDISIKLQRDDFVIFCSDGVIEAEDNESGEMYQSERLLEVIRQAGPDMSAQDMVDLILRDVIAFVGDEEASDDITIVVLRCEE